MSNGGILSTRLRLAVSTSFRYWTVRITLRARKSCESICRRDIPAHVAYDSEVDRLAEQGTNWIHYGAPSVKADGRHFFRMMSFDVSFNVWQIVDVSSLHEKY
jgi:hypothetical protein